MKLILFTICLLILYYSSNGQIGPTIHLNDSARIVGEDIISSGDLEFNSAVTPDGKTLFFSRGTYGQGFMTILFSVKSAGKWAKPKAVNFTGVYRDADPFVSANGKRLYFASDRPLDGKPFTDKDYHYFYVELNGHKIISKPKPLNLFLKTELKPTYISFADNGNIYFWAISSNKNGNIYMCEFKNGDYGPLKKLPFSNDAFFDYDPVVAGDERFIIFGSNNRKGYGSGDLWLSFKKEDHWSEPVNMGSQVNTKDSDGEPSLSKDMKTLYFSSFRESTNRPVYKNGKITTKNILTLIRSAKNGSRNIYEINISDLNENSVR